LVSAYTLDDVARICGVRAARLRDWQRMRLLDPERPDSTAFGFRDLVSVRTLVGLLDQGVPLRRIRRTLEDVREQMPEVEQPLRSLCVPHTGSRRVVLRRDGWLVETSGQLVLDFGSERVDREVVSIADQCVKNALTHRVEAREAAWDWFERGCKLDSDRSTYAEAIEAYVQAVEVDPEFSDAHCNLGSVYFNQNRKGLARECFLRALEVEPTHLEAHLNLATLMEEDGRNEAALSHYKRALASDPLCADTHVSLALLYEKLGVSRRAGEHWRRYLQLDPDGAWADVAHRHLER
jgi:tetratricopeptide (TPR) repeat protein